MIPRRCGYVLVAVTVMCIGGGSGRAPMPEADSDLREDVSE